MAEGFAFCKFDKADLPAEIGSTATLTLFCHDVLGREYECSQALKGGSDNIYVPSIKVLGE